MSDSPPEEVQEQLQLMTCPVDSLTTSELLTALQVAGASGDAVALEEINYLIASGERFFPCSPDAFHRGVVVPTEQHGLIDDLGLRRWEHDLADPAILVADARVQSYCAAWNFRVAEILRNIERMQHVLGVYLEVPPHHVALVQVGPFGQPIFDCEGETLIALTEPMAYFVADQHIMEHLWEMAAGEIVEHAQMDPERIPEIEALVEKYGNLSAPLIEDLIDNPDAFVTSVVHQYSLAHYVCPKDASDVTEQQFGPHLIWRFHRGADGNPWYRNED